MPPPPQNIAHHLTSMAHAQPHAIAIKIPLPRTRARAPAAAAAATAPAADSALQPFSLSALSYLSLTFAELNTEVIAWQQHLAARGVRPGDRVLVMVRQGLPLIASVFALFAHGAVPVIIDPGMGLKTFLRCVAHTQPRVLLGIPIARVLSHICRRAFRSIEIRIPVSGSPLARQRSIVRPDFQVTVFRSGWPFARNQVPPRTLSSLDGKKTYTPAPILNTPPSNLAAILFTSGSTGAPKGTCYEHAMFEAQIRSIRALYDIAPGERDLSMLPIFALFAPALGMTTIVPELDPSRPATLDPAKIVQAIQQEQVTNSFGSPTLWNKIADYCIAQNITLPSLRRVLCAGAPVPAALWEKARKILPNGQLHSPYGATECLPVSTISGDEIADVARASSPCVWKSSTGFQPVSPDASGACIGRPAPETQIKIIAITDTPIPTLSDARELPPNEIGEIIVTGPAVTREYDNLPEATAAAKITDTPAGSAEFPLGGRREAPPNLSSGNSAPPENEPTGWKPVLPQTIQAHGLEARATSCAAPRATIWHRMGDTGYLDAAGRLWFCGRKAERVETATGTLHTEPCEQVFRAHPQVARCALIGLGARDSRTQTPAIVIQPATKNYDCAKLAAELRALAQAHPHTASITHFYFHPDFPVDVRHNAKIHRLSLAAWASRQK